MNTPKIGEFCWNELATANVKAAKDFYGTVFNWKFTDVEMGDMTYTMIKRNDSEIGGIWPIPTGQEKQIPPHWMSYILVENLEKAIEKVLENGGFIMKPATQAGEMGRLAIITDPTGAHVALWQALNQ